MSFIDFLKDVGGVTVSEKTIRESKSVSSHGDSEETVKQTEANTSKNSHGAKWNEACTGKDDGKWYKK